MKCGLSSEPAAQRESSPVQNFGGESWRRRNVSFQIDMHRCVLRIPIAFTRLVASFRA